MLSGFQFTEGEAHTSAPFVAVVSQSKTYSKSELQSIRALISHEVRYGESIGEFKFLVSLLLTTFHQSPFFLSGLSLRRFCLETG